MTRLHYDTDLTDIQWALLEKLFMHLATASQTQYQWTFPSVLVYFPS